MPSKRTTTKSIKAHAVNQRPVRPRREVGAASSSAIPAGSLGLPELEIDLCDDELGPGEEGDDEVIEMTKGKARSKRSSTTMWQLGELEAYFKENRSPSTAHRRHIAARLGTSERQTQVWFQNRRAKARAIEKLAMIHGPIAIPPPKRAPGISEGRQLFLEGMLHDPDSILITPSTALEIGSWRREKDIHQRHDLVTYYCDARSSFTWFVHIPPYSFKMEITADNVAEARLDHLGPGRGAVVIQTLRPPNFFFDFRMADGQREWRSCMDWTEDNIASQSLVHRLEGSAMIINSVLQSFQRAIQNVGSKPATVDQSTNSDIMDLTPYPPTQVPSMPGAYTMHHRPPKYWNNVAPAIMANAECSSSSRESTSYHQHHYIPPASSSHSAFHSSPTGPSASIAMVPAHSGSFSYPPEQQSSYPATKAMVEDHPGLSPQETFDGSAPFVHNFGWSTTEAPSYQAQEGFQTSTGISSPTSFHYPQNVNAPGYCMMPPTYNPTEFTYSMTSRGAGMVETTSPTVYSPAKTNTSLYPSSSVFQPHTQAWSASYGYPQDREGIPNPTSCIEHHHAAVPSDSPVCYQSEHPHLSQSTLSSPLEHHPAFSTGTLPYPLEANWVAAQAADLSTVPHGSTYCARPPSSSQEIQSESAANHNAPSDIASAVLGSLNDFEQSFAFPGSKIAPGMASMFTGSATPSRTLARSNTSERSVALPTALPPLKTSVHPPTQTLCEPVHPIGDFSSVFTGLVPPQAPPPLRLQTHTLNYSGVHDSAPSSQASQQEPFTDAYASYGHGHGHGHFHTQDPTVWSTPNDHAAWANCSSGHTLYGTY